MRVRRAVTVTGAVAALVLLGGPAWADQTPSPAATVVVDDNGMGPPSTDDPSCTFFPSGSAEPSADPTDAATTVPTEEPTAQPTDAATDAATDAPTDTPTDGPTDAATVAPTDEPTAEPTDVATEEPTDAPTADATGTPGPGGYWVCASGGLAGGLGSGDPTLDPGAPQLPFSGAPLGRYAATGLALVLAGGGTVLLARRRQT